MDKFIDMHCHILPGVDDGAKNLEETKEMLKIAFSEGIRTIIATPHHHDRRGKSPVELLQKRLASVEKAIEELGLDMEVWLGMEVFFGQDVLQELSEGKLATMGGSGYLLLEFSPEDDFSYLQRAVQKVQMKGYRVIIAHVERYQCLVKNLDNIRYLVDMGAYIQVNASSILGGMFSPVTKFTKNMMKEHLVHFVGTDAHGTDKRSPRMKEAADFVAKKFGQEYMEHIFWKNGNRVLRDENV